MGGITTWSALSKLPNPDLDYLVEINPALFMETGSDWTSEGTNTYSHICEEASVNGVLEDGSELTEKTSVADVKATAGSWYFDLFNQTIYVHSTNSEDLSNASTDVDISVKCWKNFATKKMTFNGMSYMPIVRQDSFPLLKLSVDDVIEGFYKFNFGSFIMNNTSWWDANIDKYDWLNARVVIKIGGEQLPYSEYLTFFVGRWSDVYVSDEVVVPSIKDIRVGTFATLPINHYWLSDYPRMDETMEGRPIPIFYGRKENIIPTCIQEPRQYTSRTAPINAAGDITFEVQENIDADVPSSGIIGVRGQPTDLYYYNSWSNASGNGVFTLCTEEGCELVRDYTDKDEIYVVGTTKWKWADRKVHAVDEVRKNGEVLTPGTDYTLDLNNAELDLNVAFSKEAGDVLELDGEGFEAADSSLLIHGAEIALDIFKEILGYIDDDLDLDSFTETESLRTYELSIYLDVEESSREVLQTIGRSIVAFFTPTEDGKLAFEAYEPTVPVGTLELRDADYGKTFKITKDDSFVRNKIKILYDFDPKTQEYKEYEKTNPEVLHRFKVRETLPLKTYLKNKDDVISMAGGLLSMCSRPIDLVETSCGVKGFDLYPTRKVKLTRERAGTGDGSLDQSVFRIREVTKDTRTEQTKFVAMDDLQSLGEQFCYVCYSCQVCNTEQKSCSVCYDCEFCVASQGGCGVCDTCQLCNTDQGSCQICVSCESCDACQVTVGSCSSCESCDTCQICNTCQTTVNTCNTCQDCYGCQKCNTCDVCDTCESQVSCASCDICQVCNTTQDCTTCDVCDTCESQVSCASCNTCQNCNTCEVDDTCGTCVSCQVCNTTQDCTTCDVCDTCQSQVSCNQCDTCQSCNTCQVCNTTQDCTSCDVCVSQEVWCESCVNCQLCNTSQGGCSTCDVCNTPQSCSLCDNCVSCELCYYSQGGD